MTDVMVSVLINNYNYAGYLGEAIESVLGQSYGNLELIVVDDGSRDGSAAVINSYAERDERIIPVFKANGGQLSAFNAGVERAKGSLLFFLDADDRYRSDYLQKAVQIYRDHRACDLLCTALQEFGKREGTFGMKGYRERLTDLGYTAIVTALTHCYTGVPTSGLSMRRALAERIFPIPGERDWMTRADDCITWSSSLAGARKFYLGERLVEYRIHGDNSFASRQFDSGEDRYRRGMLVHTFFASALTRFPAFGLLDNKNLLRMLLLEASTGNKSEKMLRLYGKAIYRCRKIALLRRKFYGYALRFFGRRFLLTRSINRQVVR